jgi:ABC-2 type transport system ATP-binding protein
VSTHDRNSPAIRCVDLQKRYDSRPPVEAVRGIELDVHVGECFGLLGPNGAGKTTTIEMLEGLLAPTAGRIELFGLGWNTSERELRERVGISLQETRLADKLTVAETVTLFRSFYRQGLSPQEAIARVGLQEKANAWVVRLSGGQKQRLAIACSLVGDPELLFLDEPTTGLDPQSRRQLWDIILDFKNRGRTVLLTTHYMEEAERLCDRVAIVDQGKVIALGSPRELIARLGGEHVVMFALEGTEPFDTTPLATLPTLQTVRSEADHHILTVGEPHRLLPALLGHLQERGRPLAALSIRHASLDDVFLSLTGKALRDGGPA